MTSKIPCNFPIPNPSDYAIKTFSSAHLASNECFLLNYYSITTRDEQLLSRNGFSNFSCLDLWMLSSQSSSPITSEPSISIRLYIYLICFTFNIFKQNIISPVMNPDVAFISCFIIVLFCFIFSKNNSNHFILVTF